MTCGRDGGLQNMELHGMIMLHISDEKFARIRLHVENEDKRGVQLQVKSVWSLRQLKMFLLLSRGKISGNTSVCCHPVFSSKPSQQMHWRWE